MFGDGCGAVVTVVSRLLTVLGQLSSQPLGRGERRGRLVPAAGVERLSGELRDRTVNPAQVTDVLRKLCHLPAGRGSKRERLAQGAHVGEGSLLKSVQLTPQMYV